MHSGTRWSYTLFVTLLATIAAALIGGTASAQTDDGSDDIGVFGQLTYEDIDLGEDVAAVGVTVSVEGVGETQTDANGDFRIAVPEPGDYTVTLVVESLPDGVNLRNPDANPLDATVNDRDRRVLFPLVFGEAEESTAGAISFRAWRS